MIDSDFLVAVAVVGVRAAGDEADRPTPAAHDRPRASSNFVFNYRLLIIAFRLIAVVAARAGVGGDDGARGGGGGDGVAARAARPRRPRAPALAQARPRQASTYYPQIASYFTFITHIIS